MNLKDFNSGQWVQQYQYKSFTPAKINHTFVWDDAQINTLLESATRALGELNAFTLILPDVDLYIYMHIVKEANTSSRIEGTRTGMDEALMKEEDIRPERRDDWREVQNYIKAMNYAIEELKRLPLSNRLLRKTHEILMTGVLGEHKLPGEFRRSQNWIGGSSLSDAVFIPPHHEEVPELMSDLEKLVHNQEINVPHLIKIAVAYYQFETIHPFLDGNGRIGRLMITLYLVSQGLLKKLSLYLSDFFEKHKSSYYDALMYVRNQNDLGHWIKFFLNTVNQTAEKGIKTFNEILRLKNEVNNKLIGLGRKAENGQKLIHYLYTNPIVNVSRVSDLLKLSIPASNQLINKFEELDLLTELTGYKRNRLFYFKRYYELYLS